MLLFQPPTITAMKGILNSRQTATSLIIYQQFPFSDLHPQLAVLPSRRTAQACPLLPPSCGSCVIQVHIPCLLLCRPLQPLGPQAQPRGSVCPNPVLSHECLQLPIRALHPLPVQALSSLPRPTQVSPLPWSPGPSPPPLPPPIQASWNQLPLASSSSTHTFSCASSLSGNPAPVPSLAHQATQPPAPGPLPTLPARTQSVPVSQLHPLCSSAPGLSSLPLHFPYPDYLSSEAASALPQVSLGAPGPHSPQGTGAGSLFSQAHQQGLPHWQDLHPSCPRTAPQIP